MVQVIVGDNLNRKQVIADENNTLRQILESNDIDYTRGLMHLDGTTLKAGDLDKKLSDFGIAEKCYLLNVAKADNA